MRLASGKSLRHEPNEVLVLVTYLPVYASLNGIKTFVAIGSSI